MLNCCTISVWEKDVLQEFGRAPWMRMENRTTVKETHNSAQWSSRTVWWLLQDSRNGWAMNAWLMGCYVSVVKKTQLQKMTYYLKHDCLIIVFLMLPEKGRQIKQYLHNFFTKTVVYLETNFDFTGWNCYLRKSCLPKNDIHCGFVSNTVWWSHRCKGPNWRAAGTPTQASRYWVDGHSGSGKLITTSLKPAVARK